MAPHALVGAICISCKIVHQIAPLAPGCVTCTATLPYWHYQLVLSWYPHQPASHQLSFKNALLLTDGQTSGPKDRTPGLPGSHKNWIWIRTGCLFICLWCGRVVWSVCGDDCWLQVVLVVGDDGRLQVMMVGQPEGEEG